MTTATSTAAAAKINKNKRSNNKRCATAEDPAGAGRSDSEEGDDVSWGSLTGFCNR